MLKTCLNCDNLVLVMGTFICNLHKQIIHYPNKSGQFCENYMEAEKDNVKQRSRTEKKVGVNERKAKRGRSKNYYEDTNPAPKEKPATNC